MATEVQGRIFRRGQETDLRNAVVDIVSRTPTTDVHTHLCPEAFGELLLWGIDDLVTYHYLIAETMRVAGVRYDRYWAMTKREQANLIWDELFVKRSPISESCRGVLTVLERLGLDLESRDLEGYRAYFEKQNLGDYISKVFELANLKSVVMTNDVFDDIERAVWERGVEVDSRFHAVLRMDPLLNDWETACGKLKAWDYAVEKRLTAKTLSEVRRFLTDWLDRMKALYMAVSLPPTFAYPEKSPRGKLIEECILPVSHERNVPFAMMIGVKKLLNPALQLAGDGVGKCEISVVEHLCANYPDNKFIVTILARENQHELCVAARKFPNLFIFGCWWFLNNPSLVEEITRMRIELLGLSVVPQHSDARVLDQLVYKWEHSRAVIGRVLADKYADLAATGWAVKESEIERDVARLMGANFWDFLA